MSTAPEAIMYSYKGIPWKFETRCKGRLIAVFVAGDRVTEWLPSFRAARLAFQEQIDDIQG